MKVVCACLCLYMLFVLMQFIDVPRTKKAGAAYHISYQYSYLLSEDRAYSANHLQGAVAKTKKATNILRPAIDVTFDKDAEFKVFYEVGVAEVRFFSFFSSSVGGSVIKSKCR